MKYTLKLNCHDWPKRGDKSRREVTIEAASELEAWALGMAEAEQNWPGAKLKIFDVAPDRIAAWEAKQAAEQSVSRETRAPVPHQVRNKLGLRPTDA